jgi:hypothetical protein
MNKIAILLFVVATLADTIPLEKFTHPDIAEMLSSDIPSEISGFQFFNPGTTITIVNEDKTIAIVDPPSSIRGVFGLLVFGENTIRPIGGKIAVCDDIIWCEGCTGLEIAKKGKVIRDIHVAGHSKAYPGGSSDEKEPRKVPTDCIFDIEDVKNNVAGETASEKTTTKYSGFNVETQTRRTIHTETGKFEEFIGDTNIRTGTERKATILNCKSVKLDPGFDRDFVVVDGDVVVDNISFRARHGRGKLEFKQDGSVDFVGYGWLETKEEGKSWSYDVICENGLDCCHFDVFDYWKTEIPTPCRRTEDPEERVFKKDIFVNTGETRSFMFVGEKSGYLSPPLGCSFVMEQRMATIDGFEFLDENGRGGISFDADGKVESLRGDLYVLFPGESSFKTWSDVIDNFLLETV